MTEKTIRTYCRHLTGASDKTLDLLLREAHGHKMQGEAEAIASEQNRRHN